MGVTASAESSVDCLSMEQLSVCSTSSTFDFRHSVQFICSFLHCPLLPSSRGTKPQAWQCECEAFHSQCVYSTIVFWAYGKSVKWDWWWGDDGRFVYCVNQEHRRLPPGCLFSCRCRTSEHVGSRLTETQHRDCAMLKYFFFNIFNDNILQILASSVSHHGNYGMERLEKDCGHI